MKIKQKCFEPINSIRYRFTGVIIGRDERYSLRSAEVYRCLELNGTLFSCQLLPKACRYIHDLFLLIKALYLAAFYIGG